MMNAKHVKIKGRVKDLLKKVRNGEVLKAYTEGYEQDTMTRIYEDRKTGALVIDFGHGVKEEAEGNNEDDLRWLIGEANGASKLSRMQFLMDEVERYVVKTVDRLNEIRIADIRVDGATEEEIRYAVNELAMQAAISIDREDDVVWWC